MQGWIKLHRQLIKWEWFQDSKMVHLFIHLLLLANHEPNKWQGIQVERGQVITGLKALNEATGISTQTLRTCLSRLEKAGNLTSKSTNKYRIITLCNYETYQIKESADNKPANKQLTINQQSTNKQLTPNKNDETDEKEKNEKKFVKDISSFSPQSRISSASQELKFYGGTCDLFGVAGKSDRTTLANVAKHLSKSLDENVFDKAWRVAQECKKKGSKPIALFMSRMKDEFDYRSLK